MYDRNSQLTPDDATVLNYLLVLFRSQAVKPSPGTFVTSMDSGI